MNETCDNVKCTILGFSAMGIFILVAMKSVNRESLDEFRTKSCVGPGRMFDSDELNMI